MDERITAYNDAPASSSRESAKESQRKVQSENHSVYSHLSKDRNRDIFFEDQNNKDNCRKLSKNNHVHVKQKILRKRRRRKFLESTSKSKVIGNTLEFGKSCEDLTWNHCPSTSHRSDTNDITEREDTSQEEIER